MDVNVDAAYQNIMWTMFIKKKYINNVDEGMDVVYLFNVNVDVGSPIYYSQISHGNMSHGYVESHYIITMDPSKKL